MYLKLLLEVNGFIKITAVESAKNKQSIICSYPASQERRPTEMEIAIITERASEQPFEAGGNGGGGNGGIWRYSPSAAPLENEKSAPLLRSEKTRSSGGLS